MSFLPLSQTPIIVISLKILDPKEVHTHPSFFTEDCQKMIDIYKDFYPQIGFVPPWVGYFILNDDTVVGFCGFVGAPQNGQVELSYYTFEKYEGQGIATTACKLMVDMAVQTDDKLTITAKTAPFENASTKILTKNGFVYKEVVQDHEIGDAWLWVYGPQ
ncbi:MAG: GNAT family N-acetyltransferase [Saprospiraceae bacterium]|nr:GNAT family N-acetyltransferase [Saprospiraceae bacterium]